MAMRNSLKQWHETIRAYFEVFIPGYLFRALFREEIS